MDNTLTLRGEFVELDTPNSNGFIFPKECVERVIQDFKEKSKKDPVYGSLGEKDPTLVVNASHEILNLELKDNKIVGVLKVLETPEGNKLRDLIERKTDLYGSYVVDANLIASENNNTTMLDVHELITINVTNEPTHKNKTPLSVVHGLRTEEEWIDLYEAFYAKDVLWYVLGGLISSDSFYPAKGNELCKRYEESIDTLKRMGELLPKTKIPYNVRRKAAALAKKSAKMLEKEYNHYRKLIK